MPRKYTRKNTNKNAAKQHLEANQKELTQYVIDNLSNGVSWAKCWERLDLGLPTSIGTEKPYRGVNTYYLAMVATKRGYDSNEWGTFKAWKSKGYRVTKGGVKVVFYKPIFEEKDGKMQFKCAILKYSTVFNRCQTDAPPVEAPKEGFECKGGILYDYISNQGIALKTANRACYSPVKDTITLPKRYTDQARGWATIAHEIIHSTGHEQRLNREGVANFDSFGSHQYSYEELIAELGSLFLCGHLNLSTEDSKEQSAAYIKGWLKVLKSNPDWIWDAAKEAAKAAQFVLEEGEEAEGEEAA